MRMRLYSLASIRCIQEEDLQLWLQLSHFHYYIHLVKLYDDVYIVILTYS